MINTDDLINKYKKVAVIMGGASSEREISLLSGNAVLNSLIKSGVNAFKFDPSEDDLRTLPDICDCAIIMLHGKIGEDGVIQGLLTCFKIPYAGSDVRASALAMDKIKTKIIWSYYGIPTPRWQSVKRIEYINHTFELNLALPVIVKPASEGSTIGVSKVFDMENLSKALANAFDYGEFALIEELIIGEEYAITVHNNTVYPMVKIEAPNDSYDYNNKYFSDETKYTCPVSLPQDVIDKINEYALLGYKSIGADGVARIDCMMTKKYELAFLEINTIPGMTNHSLVPNAFRAANKSFDDLCLVILNDARLH